MPVVRSRFNRCGDTPFPDQPGDFRKQERVAGKRTADSSG